MKEEMGRKSNGGTGLILCIWLGLLEYFQGLLWNTYMGFFKMLSLVDGSPHMTL